MMRLTRKEREELVLDLYNQGKTYSQITKEARICPRDIKTILQKGSNENESTQSLSKAARAYEMFSEDKSPMEVAITLDMREPEVTQLYKESWNLKQIHDLNKIYLETNGDLASFVNLYKLARSEGMKIEHFIWFLKVANKGLPELDLRYYNLKSEVDALQVKKENLLSLIQYYSSQITALGKAFDNYCLRCEEEEIKLTVLRTKRMKEEALATFFRNNDAEYLKIRKTVEEKVRSTLSDRKKILKFAALSLIESIRENPQKYNSLIHQDLPPAIDYTSPDFNPYNVYCQQQYVQPKAYFTEDYVVMLSEDADKLLEKLVKELGDEILSDYTVNKVSPTLPMLPTVDGNFDQMEQR